MLINTLTIECILNLFVFLTHCLYRENSCIYGNPTDLKASNSKIQKYLTKIVALKYERYVRKTK